MKKIKILLLLTAIVLVLTGCFEVETNIKLNKNGSGTMEETMLFSQMMMMQMAQMGQAFGGEEEDSSENPVYDVEKLKAEAADKGEGVTYASSEAIERNGKSGYKVIYNFKDINTLKYSNDPSKKMNMPTMGMEDEATEEFVRFQYSKGNLIINFPEEGDGDEEYTDDDTEEFDQEELDDGVDEMAGMEEMMKQMFTDMKFKTTIEFEGGIKKTNATFVEGNKITLMEMDFNKVMENAEAFKTLGTLQSATPAQQKEAMKNLPGIKFEAEEKITVNF